MSELTLPVNVIEYIDKTWKPNQDDSFIEVVENSDDYLALKEIFDNQMGNKTNIGPFVGVTPYGYFPRENNRVEFLFIYDSIDNTKLKMHHLALT